MKLITKTIVFIALGVFMLAPLQSEAKRIEPEIAVKENLNCENTIKEVEHQICLSVVFITYCVTFTTGEPDECNQTCQRQIDAWNSTDKTPLMEVSDETLVIHGFNEILNGITVETKEASCAGGTLLAGEYIIRDGKLIVPIKR